MNSTFRSLKISLVAAMFACFAFPAQAEPEVVRLSEPVVASATAETFGAPLDESVPAASLAEIAEDGNRFLGQSVRVQARVAKVCQKKGCFFVAQDGAATIRISFKDYAFFVPSDIGGRTVTFVGEVIEKELTAKQAAHFVQDAGAEAAALKPGRVYEIVARSVRVPLS